jgi:hypothetical protein
MIDDYNMLAGISGSRGAKSGQPPQLPSLRKPYAFDNVSKNGEVSGISHPSR